jgi:hypothetical protein
VSDDIVIKHFDAIVTEHRDFITEGGDHHYDFPEAVFRHEHVHRHWDRPPHSHEHTHLEHTVLRDGLQ